MSQMLNVTTRGAVFALAGLLALGASHAHASSASSPTTTASATLSGAVATLNQPLGITLDRAGNLYVANLNAGVTIYNPQLQLTGNITAGVGLPVAVGVSVHGDRIYVANQSNNSITIYNPAHNQTGSIYDGTLGTPRSLYVDFADDLYVLDYPGVLHLYLDNGAAAGALQTGGSAVGPSGSAWSVWGAGSSGNYTIQEENIGEALHYGLSVTVAAAGAPLAGGVSEDTTGHQYVTDQVNNKVWIEDFAAATIQPAFDTSSVPYGIAVDVQRGRIYVSYPQTYTVGV